ncbi:hypothetical protein [Thermococcus sp. JCM 11816]
MDVVEGEGLTARSQDSQVESRGIAFDDLDWKVFRLGDCVAPTPSR